MAITDILTRIDTDAAAEAADIVGAADAEAARILGQAAATVAAERQATLAAAEHDGAEAAATLLANARLEARDGLLAQKRALAEHVLERAREALEALPDAEYVELIASAVERVAHGGETITIAPADATRLRALADMLKTRGVVLSLGSDPVDISRGVLLEGDRVRVEVSPEALVADRRDQLLLVAARALFGGTE